MTKTIYFIGNDLFPEYEMSTPTECLEYLSKQTEIGVDIETGRKYDKGTYDESQYRSGLDPYLSRIVMIQIGTLERQYIIDARTVDCKFLVPILENSNILKIGHNLKFEYRFFEVHLNCKLTNIWDTFICEKVLYNGLPLGYSLAALMQRYLGIVPVEQITLFDHYEEEYEDESIEDELDMLDWKPKKSYVNKSIRLQFVEIGDKPFTLSQIQYGADDIINPIKIKNIQIQGRPIKDEFGKDISYKPLTGFKLQNEFVTVLGSIENEGMEFDKQEWIELAKKSKNRYIALKEKLDTYVQENHTDTFCYGVDLFSNVPTCAIQWSSSKQVINFFRYLGFCPQEKSKQTKKLEWTVGAKALFKLLSADYKDKFYSSQETEIKTTEDLILNYLLLKKAEQAYTTFGEDFLKYVHPITHKIHSNYRQYMHTGRMSSTNPNLQNIPSGAEYRHCFKSKDYVWVNCDYASQESRVLADVSNNKTLIDFFNNGHEIFGTDLHSFGATNMMRKIKNDDSIIVTKKSDPEARQRAKSLNFAIPYGASSYSLKDALSCTVEEADVFVKAYFDGFPGLEKNFEETKQLALKRGWIELDGFTKQKYFFPYMEEMEQLQKEAWACYPADYKELSAQERATVKAEVNRNNPQLKGLWSKYFYYKGKLERRSLNYRIQGLSATMSKLAGIFIYRQCINDRKIINMVHDEIIAKTVQEDADAFAEIVSSEMVRAGTFVCKEVKMGAEAEVANYWKH